MELKTHILHNPEISFLVMYPREILTDEHTQKKMYKNVFNSVLCKSLKIRGTFKVYKEDNRLINYSVFKYYTKMK